MDEMPSRNPVTLGIRSPIQCAPAGPLPAFSLKRMTCWRAPRRCLLDHTNPPEKEDMCRLSNRYSDESKRFCDMHWAERKVCNLGFSLGRFLNRIGCYSYVTWESDRSVPVYTFWLFSRVGISHRLRRKYPVKLYAYSILMGHATTAEEAKEVTLEWAKKNGYSTPVINEIDFMSGYGWSTDFHWYGP